MPVRMSGTVLLLSTEECRLWQAFDSHPRYVLVCNPFDPRRAAALSPSHPTDESRGKPPVVLFAGRLLREKGVLDLVRAFPQVLQTTQAVLVLVGDGPDRAECLDLARRLGIAEHVRLSGYLKGDALDAAYKTATVFAFPSYWPEGFPTVLSEAMAAGLPIVTTATRGAADHLREPENALFVPPRNPKALAEAITRILTDADLAASMSSANRAKVGEFDPDVIVGAYLEALAHAAGGRRSA
jgi:glycosyltransferase involved in cell wall biosynthesis